MWGMCSAKTKTHAPRDCEGTRHLPPCMRWCHLQDPTLARYERRVEMGVGGGWWGGGGGVQCMARDSPFTASIEAPALVNGTHLKAFLCWRFAQTHKHSTCIPHAPSHALAKFIFT